MCVYFEKGVCQKGSRCRFAHGTEELRVAPNLQGTKRCPVLRDQGHCSDPQCRFAHEAEDVRRIRFKPAAPEVPAGDLVNASAESSPHRTRARRQRKRQQQLIDDGSSSTSVPCDEFDKNWSSYSGSDGVSTGEPPSRDEIHEMFLPDSQASAMESPELWRAIRPDLVKGAHVDWHGLQVRTKWMFLDVVAPMEAPLRIRSKSVSF